MACPLVAGVAALMKSAAPTASKDAIESCLLNEGTDNIDAQNPAYFGLLGKGRVNAYKAVQCISGGVYASFTSTGANPCVGSTVAYSSTSLGSITGYNWTFVGGSPFTYNLSNPTVTYPSAGTYTTILRVTNGVLSHTYTAANYVNVFNPSGSISGNATITQGGQCYAAF